MPGERNGPWCEEAFRSLCTIPVLVSTLVVLAAMAFGILDDFALAAIPVETAFFPGDVPEPSRAVPVLKAAVESRTAPEKADELVLTRHRVARGETLSRIAYEYGLSPSTLISINALDVRGMESLDAGGVLLVPYRDGFRVTPEAGESAEDIARIFETDASLVHSIPGSDDFFVSGPEGTNLASVDVDGDYFLYPVIGRILTAYGRGMDGLTGIPYDSEGVDLAADRGTPVTASRRGTVLFTGHHGSYGLYVMMSHPGGWKSFYGHLDRIDVAPGDELDAADVLGTVGDSGTARTPRLHFALFRGSESVDPLDYLY